MDRCALHRVYRLVFPNGKSYVGQTRRLPQERFREHVKGKSLVGAAIEKYGAENVRLRTTIIVPSDRIDVVERIFIAAYDTLTPNGYNVAGGGRGVMKAPTREEYARLRCAFWSARMATRYETWANELTDDVADIAPYVYEYAKRLEHLQHLQHLQRLELPPSRYPDRSVF